MPETQDEAQAEPVVHPREARFHELDILRGIAALMVVTFHYKHFFFISDGLGFDYAHMPFFRLLEPLYVYGQFFVELFFAISGYVFYWLYARGIAERSIGGGAFFVARFSRLYPLYLLTFLAVAVMQWSFHALYGANFIYPHNNLSNFALNLFMVQQWQLYPELSFNGPAWSISVEVFLYAVFFGLTFFRLNGWRTAVAMVAIGLLWKYAVNDPHNDFVRGLPAFFLGGLVWHAMAWLKAHETWRKRVTLAVAVVTPLAWLIAAARTDAALLTQSAMPPLPDPLSPVLNTESFIYLCTPLTLLLFGLMQGRWPAPVAGALHRLGWLGDISYSVYLIHFPLQLALMLFINRWPLAQRSAFFGSPLTFVAFMATACGLAWLSFHAFEMPVRRWLRGVMLRRLAPSRTME